MPASPVAFTPSGVITLTTDFGLRDPFVGVMKGQVLRRLPQARLVDLTHEIEAHGPDGAGFWLGRCYPYFPAGTVHVAVVDPGVGSARAIVAVEGDGHLFLAPDNGLLAGVLARLRDAPVLRQLDLSRLPVTGLGEPSATFHGRDIFAPVAAELASGRLAPADLGPVVPQIRPGALPAPVRSGAGWLGRVVTVDHFGNLLTNLDAALVAGVPAPSIRAEGRELPLVRTYADLPPGGYGALVNSFAVLEVAGAGQSAARGLGLGRGAVVTIESKVAG